MHKIYLDGVTRFCETPELSFYKKLGYEEIKDEKPVVKEEKKEVEEIEEVKPKAKKGNKKGV
jgi:hypothetical protein